MGRTSRSSGQAPACEFLWTERPQYDTIGRLEAPAAILRRWPNITLRGITLDVTISGSTLRGDREVRRC